MKRVIPDILTLTLCTLSLFAVTPGAHAGDWPTWRFDARRSGSSDLELPETLHLQWTLELPAPRPAWPSNQEKLLFDRLYEPIVLGRSLIIPSMVNDTVTAYDTRTGEERWSFIASGPVRLAAAGAKGRVYFGSDDGYFYCLDAENGKLLWKFLGGPSEKWLVGNERLINMWPCRGAPVIVDNTVYFGASIWPFMGTFLYALDAETGAERWTNSGTGANYHLQQHHSPAFAGVAPQGYFAVSGDYLVVSGGRTVPAVFDRHTGKYLHFVVWSREMGSKGGGGYEVMAGDDYYVNRGKMYRLDDGSFIGSVEASVLTKNAMIGANAKGLVGFRSGFVETESTDRKGETTKKIEILTNWQSPLKTKIERVFAKSGSKLYAQAANNTLLAVTLPTLESGAYVTWEAPLPDRPLNLITADDRLFVSTELGRIYCFGAEKTDAKFPTPVEVNLISKGSTWRYVDTGPAPDASWKNVEFDDSKWPSGPAELGFGDNTHATLLLFGTDPKKKRITYHFRQEFESATAGLVNLKIQLRIDDGGILYLNGEELKRVHMADGEVTPDTVTIGEPAGNTTLKLAFDRKALRAGKNVLAVEVHQRAAHSSDLAFDLELTADVPGARTTSEPTAHDSKWESIVGSILRQCSVTEGYAVALGIGSGRLVSELLGQSRLHVIVIDPDAERIGEFRRSMIERGLYGTRVSALVGHALDMDIAPYFANVVVSEVPETQLFDKSGADLETAVRRIFALLRPFDGTACFASTSEQYRNLEAATDAARLDQGTLERSGDFAILRRIDAPTGSGEWTHQYADAGNTVRSTDRLVKAPLGILWWGGPSNEGILPRHGHGPTPQVAGGRLFIEGRNFMRAVDIYTGRLLWQRPLQNVGQNYDYTSHEPGANAIGSNYVSLRDSVYLIYGKDCLRLDPATGETISKFQLPKRVGADAPPNWGHLAAWRNLLVAGSVSDFETADFSAGQLAPITPEHMATLLKELTKLKRFRTVERIKDQSDVDYLTANVNVLLHDDDMVARIPRRVRFESDAAEEVETRLEAYLAEVPGRQASDEEALRIKRELLHHYYKLPLIPKIDVGRFGSLRQTGSKKLVGMDRFSGRVHWEHECIYEMNHNAIAIGGGTVFYIDKMSNTAASFYERRGLTSNHNARIAAIDARTGKLVWKKTDRIFGTWLGYSEEHDVLLQAGSRASDRSRNEIGQGMVAYRGTDGTVLWENELHYSGPCILLGNRVITQGYNSSGFALDLLTGKQEMLAHPVSGEPMRWEYRRSYGCNTGIGAPNLLTFRSAAAGYFDLISQSGTGNFGGFRSGCTSNLIPAGGILNAPDYTRTCTCSYQNQSSLALIHMPEVETWAFGAQGPDDHPVHTLGLNLGAPGDRRDPDGTLWLDAPSVGGSSPDVPLTISLKDVEYQRFHTTRIEEGPLPWVGASAVEGDGGISIQLRFPNAFSISNEVASSGRLETRGVTVTPDVFAATLPGSETKNATSLRRSKQGGPATASILGDGRFATPDVTVEFWVRTDGHTALVDATINGTEKQHGYVVANGEKPHVSYYVANEAGTDNEPVVTITAKDPLAANTWVHLAFTYEKATGIGRLHLNGANICEHDGPDGRGLWWDAEAPGLILIPGGGGGLRLDELRVSAVAVKPESFLSATSTGVSPDLIAGHWRMEVDSAGLLEDAGPESTPQLYDLRLFFAELANLGPGERIFDVRVQGKAALEKLDICREAGGPNRVIIKKVKGVEVRDFLRLDLKAHSEHRSILNGIEISPSPPRKKL